MLTTLTFKKRRTGDFADKRLAQEAAAYRDSSSFWTARVPGWSSPRLVAVHPEERVLALTRLPGEPCTWQDATRLATRLGEAVACTLGAAPHAAYLPTVDDRCVRARRLIEAWEAAVDPATVRVQGDLQPANVLRDGEQLGVVDWELSRIGTVADDAGSFLAHALLAEARGSAEPGTAERALVVLAGYVPADVCAALAVTDLLRQSSREVTLGNLAGARLRDALAVRWMAGPC